MKSAPPNLSNNQIDKLGERLKAGSPSDDDLRMLSSYRNSFADAAKAVADTVREISGLEVTARSLKTTLSIVAKLKRDGVKQLSSMQDIGGCRVTVENLIGQDELVEKLMIAFPNAKLYDRVAKPSHGYRAKHLVVKANERRIEIQVRTKLQHQWALLSEAIADVFGQNLKYGVGEQVALTVLFGSANTFWKFDQLGSLMGKISFDPVAKDDELILRYDEAYKNMLEEYTIWMELLNDFKRKNDLLH